MINVTGKAEQLVDSTGDINQEKSLYTDTPVVHQYLKELNQKTFGQDRESITNQSPLVKCRQQPFPIPLNIPSQVNMNYQWYLLSIT